MARVQAKPFHDKTVLVTGASRGIGFAMARAFGEAGATVLMLARDARVLQQAADALAIEGLRTWAHAADVTDPASVATALDAAVSTHGRIDVLVNNAGWGIQRPFLQQTPHEARREWETNYVGAAQVLRACLPHMVAAGGGAVLNVSSVCGMVATPSMANYSASKAALNLLVHSLRGELAHRGVRFCVFVPGHTATALGMASRFDGVPMNDPAGVARAAVRAAQELRPEYYASWGDRLLVAIGRFSPRLAERLMARTTQAVMRAAHAIATPEHPSSA